MQEGRTEQPDLWLWASRYRPHQVMSPSTRLLAQLYTFCWPQSLREGRAGGFLHAQPSCWSQCCPSAFPPCQHQTLGMPCTGHGSASPDQSKIRCFSIKYMCHWKTSQQTVTREPAIWTSPSAHACWLSTVRSLTWCSRAVWSHSSFQIKINSFWLHLGRCEASLILVWTNPNKSCRSPALHFHVLSPSRHRLVSLKLFISREAKWALYPLLLSQISEEVIKHSHSDEESAIDFLTITTESCHWNGSPEFWWGSPLLVTQITWPALPHLASLRHHTRN